MTIKSTSVLGDVPVSSFKLKRPGTNAYLPVILSFDKPPLRHEYLLQKILAVVFHFKIHSFLYQNSSVSTLVSVNVRHVWYFRPVSSVS